MKKLINLIFSSIKKLDDLEKDKDRSKKINGMLALSLDKLSIEESLSIYKEFKEKFDKEIEKRSDDHLLQHKKANEYFNK